MRSIIAAVTLTLLPAAAFAQTARASLTGAGGFATTPDGTAGELRGEFAYQIARNLFVIGDLGRFQNLQPSDAQTAVDVATLALSNNGVVVTGTPRVPAWYTTGGLRVQVPTRGHLTPYAFGSIGVAHLTPTASFSYTSGTLGDATPAAGQDVTNQVVSLGQFVQPDASNALMVSGGGGVQLPVAHHVTADIGYRLSRVAADTPLIAQGMTFGIGYRF